ncbi:MAG: methyltransferase domain-containing protein, partial [Bdellovibrionales bacterium]|nr:methyltransferase domain-containing protein [Bdellovibrionales bacterium]
VLNEQAPVFLRINSLKTNQEKLIEDLYKEEIETEIIPNSEAIKLQVRKNVFITKAFKDGMFEVQDIGSQKISQFLNPQPGDKVIDACAGAGGKSLHMANLMQNKGKILSLDIHEWKLKELRKRARRNSIDIIECREITSQKVIKRLQSKADKLLLDVPCSGLGVLKRNPDTKWKVKQETLDDLRKTQAYILENYSQMVKPGGEMVYATCSVLPSENEKQIEAFLEKHSGEWHLLNQESLAPKSEFNDGFYMAKLKRL